MDCANLVECRKFSTKCTFFRFLLTQLYLAGIVYPNQHNSAGSLARVLVPKQSGFGPFRHTSDFRLSFSVNSRNTSTQLLMLYEIWRKESGDVPLFISHNWTKCSEYRATKGKKTKSCAGNRLQLYDTCQVMSCLEISMFHLFYRIVVCIWPLWKNILLRCENDRYVTEVVWIFGCFISDGKNALFPVILSQH